jgi:hypothetical protein
MELLLSIPWTYWGLAGLITALYIVLRSFKRLPRLSPDSFGLMPSQLQLVRIEPQPRGRDGQIERRIDRRTRRHARAVLAGRTNESHRKEVTCLLNPVVSHEATGKVKARCSAQQST